MKKIKRLISALERIHPEIAVRAAHQLFRFPPKPEIPPNSDHLVKEAKGVFAQATHSRIRLGRYQLATYHFHGDHERSGNLPRSLPRKKALVIHGWTSASFYMTRIIRTLLDEDFEVVAFDFPAHGRSSGKFASFTDAVPAILKMHDEFGGFDLAVGHSFGSAMLLYAVEGGAPFHRKFPVEKIILFAPPEDIHGVIERFSQELGLSPKLNAVFRKRLEKIAKRPLREISGSEFLRLLKIPTHLIHDPADTEIPFSESKRLKSAGDFVHLHETNGLGHREVLLAESAMEFLRKAVRS